MNRTTLLSCVLMSACGMTAPPTDPLDPSQLIRRSDGGVAYQRPAWCARCSPCDCTCADPIGVAPATVHVLIGRGEATPNAISSPSFRATMTTPFWMGRFPVTNRCLGLCRLAGACPSVVPDPAWAANVQLPQRADFAAVGVVRDAAVRVCAFFGGTLPTSAQWEFSARGTDERYFPWGNTADCTTGRYISILAPSGQTFCAAGTSLPDPLPVGAFPSSAGPFGTQDLLGSVEQWVVDYAAGANYYQSMRALNTQGTEPTDPTGPLQPIDSTPADFRLGVLRGSTADVVGSHFVFGAISDAPAGNYGARCLWTTDQEAVGRDR